MITLAFTRYYQEWYDARYLVLCIPTKGYFHKYTLYILFNFKLHSKLLFQMSAFPRNLRYRPYLPKYLVASCAAQLLRRSFRMGSNLLRLTFHIVFSQTIRLSENWAASFGFLWSALLQLSVSTSSAGSSCMVPCPDRVTTPCRKHSAAISLTLLFMRLANWDCPTTVVYRQDDVHHFGFF